MAKLNLSLAQYAMKLLPDLSILNYAECDFMRNNCNKKSPWYTFNKLSLNYDVNNTTINKKTISSYRSLIFSPVELEFNNYDLNVISYLNTPLYEVTNIGKYNGRYVYVAFCPDDASLIDQLISYWPLNPIISNDDLEMTPYIVEVKI